MDAPFEDSRRLTGANLYFDGAGAALETAPGLAPDGRVLQRWQDTGEHQRGFPGAGGAHDGGEGPLPDLFNKVGDGRVASEEEVGVLGAEIGEAGIGAGWDPHVDPVFL